MAMVGTSANEGDDDCNDGILDIVIVMVVTKILFI